ncbi:hypothetical protein NFX46_15925 [Streptomyces phaeoluteigriseus]|uniref:Uncharacterized protein n=1 Tax=Streptomyces phaeoluteigriseus TaxID=114686 RepID=A0ABY4Z9E5_9ACTN|nr:hypothetical protein [Streptomyces phaeoluteigriseus]USQ85145.1 hypothetical protein NFX46_15925 [Streptomyces phaeoluteigriseus]
MTVPEENRKKTDPTDEAVGEGADTGASSPPGTATGRTMREAMEEAGVRSEDYEGSQGSKGSKET